MQRFVLAVGLSLVVLAGCSKDPSTPEYWDERIADAKSKKEKKAAVEALRAKHMSPAMVPMLCKRLDAEKSPEVKAAIARVLGEAKDKSATEALLNAVDLGASDSDARTMNKEIALALGEIKDPKAVPTLGKMLKVKGDNYTVIAAIEALGALQAKEAFEPLYELATDDAVETFITKKAIMALGDIGDPRAVPGVVKAMFKERKGVSFYMEASFALYQFGQPAADALVPVVEGKDKELLAWAEKNNIKDVALYAKATQVLGDLHDMRAEKALVGFLNFKSEFDDIKLIMRMRAADALGRMRSKEAAKVLAPMLLEEEANARHEYVWAISRIGGKDAYAKLVESSGKGSWDAREQSMRGVAMIGDEPAVFDKFAKEEEKLMTAECKEDPEYSECKDMAASVKKHIEKMSAFKLRAAAAAECKGDAGCWARHLDDKDEGVRERAAYEVGRSGKAEVIGELMKRLTEKNLDTRLAFIQGADWLVHDSKAAMAEAQKSLPALEKQIADEKGKTDFVKVNEDLRRLYVKVKRG